MIILGHHCVAILFGENANFGTFLTINALFLSVVTHMPKISH